MRSPLRMGLVFCAVAAAAGLGPWTSASERPTVDEWAVQTELCQDPPRAPVFEPAALTARADDAEREDTSCVLRGRSLPSRSFDLDGLTVRIRTTQAGLTTETMLLPVDVVDMVLATVDPESWDARARR
jgi:hypothetical protein